MEKTTLATKHVTKKSEICLVFTVLAIVVGLTLFFMITEIRSEYPSSALISLDVILLVLSFILGFLMIYEYRKGIKAPEIIVEYTRGAFTIYTNRQKYVTVLIQDLIKCDLDNSHAVPIMAGGRFLALLPYKTKYGSVIFKIMIDGKKKKIKSFPIDNIDQAIISILNIATNIHA